MTTLCDRIRAGIAHGRVARGMGTDPATATYRPAIVVDEENLDVQAVAGGVSLPRSLSTALGHERPVVASTH